MILKKPSRFLASALLVTCGFMAVQNFANAADFQVQPEQEVVQDNAMLKSSDFASNRYFASKSMDGQKVRFLVEGRDVTYEGLPDVPRATPVVMDMKDPGCVVNFQDNGWVKAGDNLSFHGARGDLLLVNSELARVSNTNHEMGHCIDFSVMPGLKADLAGTGANINSVINIALVQALEGDGAVDLVGVAAKGADYVLENRMAAFDAGLYTTAVKEAYADLHAVYQTAALTGSYDGFTGVINNYRQAVKWDFDHADALAVYRVLADEQAKGVNPADFIGKSHEQVTDYVNQLFQDHFYENGKLSVNSPGFKSIVEEVHIRGQLTIGVEPGKRAMMERFDALLDDGALHRATMEFMALSQQSVANQQQALSAGTVDAEHLTQAIEVVEKQAMNHEAALVTLGMTQVQVQQHIEGSKGLRDLFAGTTAERTAEKDAIYQQTSGGVVMRRAIQSGSDYGLSDATNLVRASFKEALKKQDLIKDQASITLER
ncbi:hypothetical protein [Pseudomonas sp. S1(2024)]|uniref:hypothetical protein n=1 Tax=Pseudomonas sp. S1(2024) TaxID=3390191 RepID=UPI003978C1A2